MKRDLQLRPKGVVTIIKILRSKRWTAVLLAILILLLGGLTALGIRFFKSMDTSMSVPMFLSGTYSVDGGEEKEIPSDGEITDRFSDKIVFKGKLSNYTYYYRTIGLSSKNVWYSLKNSKGQEVISYEYHTVEEVFNDYFGDQNGDGVIENDYASLTDEAKKEFSEEYYSYNFIAHDMPNTPGYSVMEINLDYPILASIGEEEVATLEVINPYNRPQSDFSDCLSIVLSESNGEYTRFLFTALPWIFLCLLVCFFGLFFFPVAGFILGKVDYRYLSFGVLCFFWGLFMIGQHISSYLNLWITDPTVCLLIHILTNYFFILAILIYMKSNLERSVPRAIANIVNTIYLALVIILIVLHFTKVADAYVTAANMMAVTAVCGIILPILLFIETRTNPKALYVLVSWIPLTIAIIIDSFNHYYHFTTIDFYNFGLVATMLYQIVRTVFTLRKQYRETIRYQKMQKELYEAKVSVMVSQVQPHFMYNALSSIAILCKINPDTAYNATITFSDYLRGNMDSLKQTAPVPFEKELEHLKKYLYIEELRFGKKLKIEYDIQATDFVIPQLSIQPLVENAVKHGVGMKKKGGTVKIATRENENAYEVIISDDGVGFDPEKKKNDGRSHVGMENTKRRLKEMCDGEVVITSVIGEGTIATMILPKEGQQKDEDTMR